MRTTILALAALACLSAPAFADPQADMQAFNSAVEARDYRGASLAAAETWPSVDPASPDTVAIAREFGWIAMLADEPSTALVYSRFLIEQGGALAYPDTTPAVSRVLHDWATLSAASSASARSALLTSLQARSHIASRDLISARAAQALYAEAWSAGDWTQAESASLFVARFLDELGDTQSPARYEAKRGGAVANFMRTKSPAAYSTLYDLAGELHDLIAATPPGAGRERLAREYFHATAWGDAIYAALAGARQRQTPDRRLSIGAGRPPMAELLYPAPGEPGLPRCRLSLTRAAETPGFPFVSRFRELGGSVTFALEVMPNGTFANPQVLAAAPHPDFVQAVRDVMDSWRWSIDGSVQRPFCRMPTVHILTFEFALGR